MRPGGIAVVVIVVAVSGLLPLGSAGSPAHASSRNSIVPGYPSVSPASSASPPGPWPTYMANVERTGANFLERSIAPSNVSELRPVWSVSDNGSDFSAPIVVGGNLYFGSWNGNEYAVNATTGAVEWSDYLGTDPSCGGYTPMGISSTAAYSNGTLYLGGGDGYWYALNATTGAEQWRFLAGAGADGFYDWASALVHGVSLYIGIASCFDSPLVPAGLLELNISGSPTVTHQFNSTPPNSTGESIWTTPALDPENDTVWLTTGNENPPGYPVYANAVVGLNATTLNVSGSWQVPNVAGTDSDFGSTPTLIQAGAGLPLVVATDKNGVAYALNRSNVSASGGWAPVWNLTTGGGFSGGAFDGHTLYLAGGSDVYAVNPENGSVLWTAGMDGGGTILGSLSWANGLVYAVGGNEVEAIAASNGTVLWSFSLPSGQNGVTEPVVANGWLYVASGDYGTQGYLTAFSLPGPADYALNFQESGLPAGKAWSVSVGGSVAQTTAGSWTSYEPNGTYAYLVRGPAGYRLSGSLPGIPAVGNLTVHGGNLTETVHFVRGPTRTLTFHATGLIPGTTWCVTVGWTGCTTRGTLAVTNLTPATYPYALTTPSGYAAHVKVNGQPASSIGWVNLANRGSTIAAKYAPVLYSLTFNETGLAGGKTWHLKATCTVPKKNDSSCYGMTASGSDRASSAGGTIQLMLRNGTYAWKITPIRGYELEWNGAIDPTWSGTVSMDAHPHGAVVAILGR